MGLKIEDIQKLGEDWERQSYILLIKPEHKPPHLGLMIDGAYFSLSVRGNAIGENGAHWKQLFDRKKIPVLWVQTDSVSKEEAQQIFKRFDQTEALGSVTCLAPIKEIYQEQANFIFDLIDVLIQKEAIKGFFETAIESSSIVVPEYTMDEIQSCIAHHKSRVNV